MGGIGEGPKRKLKKTEGRGGLKHAGEKKKIAVQKGGKSPELESQFI